MYRTIPKDYGKIFISKLQLLTKISSEYVIFNKRPLEHSGIDSIAYSLFEISCGKAKQIKEPVIFTISDSSIQVDEAE